jgi:hypothetical protein
VVSALGDTAVSYDPIAGQEAQRGLIQAQRLAAAAKTHEGLFDRKWLGARYAEFLCARSDAASKVTRLFLSDPEFAEIGGRFFAAAAVDPQFATALVGLLHRPQPFGDIESLAAGDLCVPGSLFGAHLCSQSFPVTCRRSGSCARFHPEAQAVQYRGAAESRTVPGRKLDRRPPQRRPLARDTEAEARDTLREIIEKANHPAVQGFRDAVQRAGPSTADRKGMWADSTFEDLVQYNDASGPLIGTPEQIAERIVAYHDLGADLILTGFLHSSGGGRIAGYCRWCGSWRRNGHPRRCPGLPGRMPRWPSASPPPIKPCGWRERWRPISGKGR